MTDVIIRKNTERSRYEALLGDEVAGYAEYRRLDGDVIQLPHTLVERRYEGHGVGSALVHHALDDIAALGLRVDPLCPFVAAWIDRHPAYAPLVAVDRTRGAHDRRATPEP
ncbi:GNAT family N-acetyltransferase [Propionicicella superfundia]|uniref:GNAT family N-acetyltransferase n=1 Tax=Propionicicella superfundia TaxID=348582 RepID=UPI0003FECEFA|nr:GNAT family N-acetyltransferase [Propionicicella superfundia]